MYPNHYVLEQEAKVRIEHTLREAEQARLIHAANGSKGAWRWRRSVASDLKSWLSALVGRRTDPSPSQPCPAGIALSHSECSECAFTQLI